MSIDILNLKRFEESENAINVALPVWVIECEATPPLGNHLDAYETAALKLVGIGLSVSGIANTLNATESLVEDILSNLESKEFVLKERGMPWQLTERGNDFLNGNVQEKESDHSVFGLMFVNAIRKNVFPFFLEGDVDQISLFNGEYLPEKITFQNNEVKTFDELKVDRHKLRKAFRNYWKNKELVADVDEGVIEIEDAISMFEGLDSLDEELDSFDQDPKPLADKGKLRGNMFIRALNREYHKRYLHMQIVIDPRVPGGYKIESPFDQSDVDARYFLREVQWLSASGEVFVGDTSLNELLTDEIRKIIPHFDKDINDFEVFILGKVYRLYALREEIHFKEIYKDFSDIYPIIISDKSLLDMEHIVADICRYVIEPIYNFYFKGIPGWRLREIRKDAQDEIKYNTEFVRRLLDDLGIDTNKINWKNKFVSNAVGRLPSTKGNSAVEKLINIIILNYYLGRRNTKVLLSKDAERLAELTESINNIRKKVSHDKNDSQGTFSKSDYTFFMDNVFDLINILLEPFGEEL